jgi:ribose transport system substrate-binding protein
MAAAEVSAWWKQWRSGTPLHVLVLDSPCYMGAQNRATAFIDALGKSVEIDLGEVHTLDCEGSQANARKLCPLVLEAHPAVNFIFGINDPCAVGGLEAARQMGKSSVVVAGVDADSIALEELARPLTRDGGGFLFTIEISPLVYATQIAQEVEKLLLGQKPDPHVQVPVRVVRRGEG